MFASLRIAAACAALATLTVAAPVLADSVGAYHIFPTPEYRAKTGRTPHLGAGEMEYFGGPVFPNGKVVSVMWGSNVNAQTVATIPAFTAALVNSTFVDQLSIYGTHLKGVNGHKGTNQDIGRGQYLGQVQITPHNTSLNLSDKDIHKELQYQIKNGFLPPSDTDTLYMIYFPSNVSINLDGLVSCEDFGAYHFATKKKPKNSNIFYTVEPECNAGFGYLTFAASHEFAEATTDNIPTPGTNPKYPQAWNTSDGYEIADLCEGNDATLTAGAATYEVTEVYLNTTGACGTANFTSP